MDRKHLTEEAIFTFLDGTVSEYNHDIIHHLNTCDRCRSLLHQYQILYDELAREPENALSADFNQQLVQRISIQSQRRFAWAKKESLYVIFTLLAMTTMIFMRYVNLHSLIGSFSKLRILPEIILSFIRSPVLETISPIKTHLPVCLMTVIVILSVILLDRLLINRFFEPLKYHIH